MTNTTVCYQTSLALVALALVLLPLVWWLTGVVMRLVIAGAVGGTLFHDEKKIVKGIQGAFTFAAGVLLVACLWLLS